MIQSMVNEHLEGFHAAKRAVLNLHSLNVSLPNYNSFSPRNDHHPNLCSNHFLALFYSLFQIFALELYMK